MKIANDTRQFIFDLAACPRQPGLDAIHQEHLRVIRMALLVALNSNVLVEEKTRILRKFYAEIPEVVRSIGFEPAVEKAVRQDVIALKAGIANFKQRNFESLPQDIVQRRSRQHLRFG